MSIPLLYVCGVYNVCICVESDLFGLWALFFYIFFFFAFLNIYLVSCVCHIFSFGLKYSLIHFLSYFFFLLSVSLSLSIFTNNIVVMRSSILLQHSIYLRKCSFLWFSKNWSDIRKNRWLFQEHKHVSVNVIFPFNKFNFFFSSNIRPYKWMKSVWWLRLGCRRRHESKYPSGAQLCGNNNKAVMR